MYKAIHIEDNGTTFTICDDYYHHGDNVVLLLKDQNGMDIEKSIHEDQIIKIEEI